MPTAEDDVVIDTPPELAPVIDESHIGANAAVCATVDGSDNSVNVTGGSFTVGTDWGIGNKGTAIVNVSAGTINIGDDLNVGPKGGESTFNMSGGVITAAGSPCGANSELA